MLSRDMLPFLSDCIGPDILSTWHSLSQNWRRKRHGIRRNWLPPTELAITQDFAMAPLRVRVAKKLVGAVVGSTLAQNIRLAFSNEALRYSSIHFQK
jgi:hypothetical protein